MLALTPQQVEIVVDATQIMGSLVTSGALGAGVSWLVSRRQRELTNSESEARIRRMLTEELEGVHKALSDCNEKHARTDIERSEYRREVAATLAVMQRELDACKERRHG